MSWKQHFSRFLAADPERLHFAAHSHHLWPDVTLEAQERAWREAATLADRKWEVILGSVVPEAREHIARVLGLSDPTSVAFAPNTHEFLVRILSCIERNPVRVLSTDAEFHSFARQSRRLEEAGLLQVTRVPAEPFTSFQDRFLGAAAGGAFDLVWVSHVFYDSGFVFERFGELAEAITDEDCLVVVDAYHGFLAVPTDLSRIEHRVFYVAGGYKYAMSGEGVCFLHCPPGHGPRPLNTGWFAGFGALERGVTGQPVPYGTDGSRFHGATFEPTPLYRFNAVQRLLQEQGLTVARIHEHVRDLQRRFLEDLRSRGPARLPLGALLPGEELQERGHFLTFRVEEAGDLHHDLLRHGIVTDYRRDRLRFGFGLYHDPEDVDRLVARLAQALA